MLYLAEGSDLIPGLPFERASMYQWLFWEQYSHETAIAVRRFHKTYLRKPDSEIDPTLLAKCEGANVHTWVVRTESDLGLTSAVARS